MSRLISFSFLFHQSSDITSNLLKVCNLIQDNILGIVLESTVSCIFQQISGIWKVVLLLHCIRININEIIHVNLKWAVMMTPIHQSIFTLFIFLSQIFSFYNLLMLNRLEFSTYFFQLYLMIIILS